MAGREGEGSKEEEIKLGRIIVMKRYVILLFGVT